MPCHRGLPFVSPRASQVETEPYAPCKSAVITPDREVMCNLIYIICQQNVCGNTNTARTDCDSTINQIRLKRICNAMTIMGDVCNPRTPPSMLTTRNEMRRMQQRRKCTGRLRTKRTDWCKQQSERTGVSRPKMVTNEFEQNGITEWKPYGRKRRCTTVLTLSEMFYHPSRPHPPVIHEQTRIKQGTLWA